MSSEPARVDVSARDAVAFGPSETAPASSDDALKLAIKLAVDADDYDRAATLLEVAKRLATAASKGAAVVSLLNRTKR